jgi:hypothetical protein
MPIAPGKPSVDRKANRPFNTKGVASGMEGDMGLANKAPGGADYPATLEDNSPSSEYAKSSPSMPNPKDRAAG